MDAICQQFPILQARLQSVAEARLKRAGQLASVYGGQASIYGDYASIYGDYTPIYDACASIYGDSASNYGDDASICGDCAPVYGRHEPVHGQALGPTRPATGGSRVLGPSLCCYARARPCPLLRYAMLLHACWAMSGTEICYAAT
eukprot:611547-Rhodomonas_salina.1